LEMPVTLRRLPRRPSRAGHTQTCLSEPSWHAAKQSRLGSHLLAAGRRKLETLTMLRADHVAAHRISKANGVYA
jgi:hypothetical protein